MNDAQHQPDLLAQALDRIEVLEDKLAKQEVAVCTVIEGFSEMKKLLGTHQGTLECHQKALKEVAEVLAGLIASNESQHGFNEAQLKINQRTIGGSP